MKHYIDIENLRENDIVLNDIVTRRRNDEGFKQGDLITITEKFDGSNASCTYNSETGLIESFSHKNELNPTNTLNGFYDYCLTLNKAMFVNNPNFILFGEWSGCRNKIVYNQEAKGKWYIFDIYDKEKECWIDPFTVKAFCKEYGLEYVNELYVGQFISWDECRKYMHSPNYGDTQEGIVVRNARLMSEQLKGNIEKVPFILKLVNQEFKESMIKTPKEVDPEKEALKTKATEMLSQIVTKSRVEKILIKLQIEDNLLPRELSPASMKDVAKLLPKAVYDDCMKEEKEVMIACGEYAGKICGSLTMRIARSLILGE